MDKFEAMQKDAEDALRSLKTVLSLPEKNDVIRDSAIKRFEYSFDIMWKLLKAHLELQHNVLVNSPKVCFREAYRLGIIDYDKFWLKLADYRNLTVHTYKQKLAEEVYGILPQALQHFQDLLSKLRG